MKRATRNDDDCERALLRTYHVLKAFASFEDIPEETKESIGMYMIYMECGQSIHNL